MTSSLFDMVGLFDFSHSNGYVVVFICISRMAGDTDHLFTCLLAIRTSSLMAVFPVLPLCYWVF